MTRKTVALADGRVVYYVSDNWKNGGDVLVFLHGLTANHTMFERQFEYFEDKYNIIAWDAPAHGESRPFADFTYPKSAEILKKIFDENGVTAAVLAGQSMGGYIAQSFIKRYPENVGAFIGIDTTPFGEGYYSKSDIFWLKRIEPLARLYPAGIMKKAIAKQVSVTEKGRGNMLSMLEPYGRDELCRLMGIGYAAFIEDNCDLKIPCPVLIILGEKDKTGKMQSYCKEWARRTDYPLKIIKNAAHNSNVDNPDDVNKAIEDFINCVETEQGAV
ncbi:MAG: alpha/beta hydrolase [Ruminococcus sp.]|nr:alpha/beta hydrolase [Ruminococcus sp.]MCM1381657.1 alpha/beta hydrolase [Muribaculaceae bacterium]MCM1479017.1 alpha/beta hydrolase [Muribaculaceae bacterium]